METNKILNADILDLLFDGRNKEYGAYDLRKTYNRRLGRALLGMTGVVSLLFCFAFVGGRGEVKARPFEGPEIVLQAAPKEAEPPKPIELPKPKPVVQVQQIRYVTTRVVPDDQVKKDEIPPENTDLDSAKIGKVTTDGVKDPGDVTPPLDATGPGNVVAAPKKEDDDGIFRKVEVESQFPGGPAAWLRFLNRNLQFPQDAVDQGLNGTVVVKFIVDKDGNVSDVEAVSGPETGGIREEVVRVIRKSGKWTPAIQNGRYVKSYKQQPVTFQLEAQ